MIKSNLKNLIRDFAESSRFDRTNGKEKEGCFQEAQSFEEKTLV